MLLYHAVTGKITHATAVSAVTGQAGLLTHRETRKHEENTGIMTEATGEDRLSETFAGV